MRKRLLKILARLVTERPWHVIAIAIILTIICGALTLTQLTIHTDQDDLVSEELAYHKRYKDFLREFGDQEYLYVIVETAGNPDYAKAFTKALVPRLKADPDVKEVLYQVINPTLEKSFLLYLDKTKLEEIRNLTESKNTSIKDIASWQTLDDLFAGLNKEIDEVVPSEAEKELTMGFGFLSELLTSLDDAAHKKATQLPKLSALFFGEDRAYDEDGFFISNNGKFLFIMVMPNKNYATLDVIAKPLERIRNTIDAAKKEFPGIKAGLTGRPVLQADEMRISNRDMTWASIIAFIAVGLIFILFFKRIIHPIATMAVLFMACAVTYGFTAVTIGYLNILSIVFVIILIGVGVDFGIYFVSRYAEEITKHKDVKHALTATLISVGPGMVTGSVTTATAFFAICFTKFTALTELGFIAGSGILICLIFMIVVLPAVLCVLDKNRHVEKLSRDGLIYLNFLAPINKYPKIVILITLIATVAIFPFVSSLKFDNNLLNLQAKGLESVEYEKKIIEETDYSTWFCPFFASSDEEAKNIVARLKGAVGVGRIEWLSELIPEEQEEKIAIVESMAGGFKGVDYLKPLDAVDKDDLVKELGILKSHLAKFAEEAFSSGRYDAVEELDKLSKHVESIVDGLSQTNDLSSVAHLQKEFLTDLKTRVSQLAGGLSPQRITKEAMPGELINRYVSSKTGRQVVYAYPKENIWEPEKLGKFVDEMRAIDPNVTGTPIEVYESSRLMKKSFAQAAIWATLAILILIYLDFRSIKFTLLAIMPLCLGILWMIEIMGIFKIPFNLANFFSVPILIGLGVDYGIHMMHRTKEDSTKHVVLTSMGTAVFLTSSTNALGFASMLIASHQGLKSLGAIMTIGSLTCTIAPLIVLPAVIVIMKKQKIL